MISVIVTIYNLEPYLKKCVESIQNQSVDDIEIILIDDGSKDNSYVMCDKLARFDRRIKVYHQENSGIASARSLGLSKATGNYVLFVDGDDWLEKDCCSICEGYIDRYNPDIILLQYRKVYDNSIQILKNYFSSGFYDKNKIKEEIYPRMIYTGRFYEKGMDTYISGRVVRREVLLEVAQTINKNISFSEGALWLFSVMLRVNSVLIADEVVYNYRMRRDSMTIKKGTPKIMELYGNLVKNICGNGYDVKWLLRQLDYMILYLLVWSDLKAFSKQQNSCYPFTCVPRGSRVVLYGAWRFGQKFYEYVQENKIYEIVLWVDKQAEEYQKFGWNVQTPEKILEVDYDYIILGSAVYSVTESMEKTLNSLGIRKNIIKISDMPISPDDLPDEYKELKRDILRKYDKTDW